MLLCSKCCWTAVSEIFSFSNLFIAVLLPEWFVSFPFDVCLVCSCFHQCSYLSFSHCHIFEPEGSISRMIYSQVKRWVTLAHIIRSLFLILKLTKKKYICITSKVIYKIGYGYATYNPLTVKKNAEFEIYFLQNCLQKSFLTHICIRLSHFFGKHILWYPCINFFFLIISNWLLQVFLVVEAVCLGCYMVDFAIWKYICFFLSIWWTV